MIRPEIDQPLDEADFGRAGGCDPRRRFLMKDRGDGGRFGRHIRLRRLRGEFEKGRHSVGA